MTIDGLGYCWGGNEFGGLGDGSTEDRLTPVPVAGGHVFLSIEAGGNQTCGMTDSGSLYCWGWDKYGQLGSGHHHGEVIDTPVLVNGSR